MIIKTDKLGIDAGDHRSIFLGISAKAGTIQTS